MLWITPLLAAEQVTQPIETCQAQLPFGLPSIKGNAVQVCRRAYAVAPDLTAKVPLWVAYTLMPNHSVGCEPRSPGFSSDMSLPAAARATTKDYAKSGYDIGHMANAADMAWDANVQAESFILSNASPQTPNLNRGAWKLLETYVRAWAYSGRTLSIYTGGIWDANSKRIGNGVVVPDRFFKIVVDVQTKEVLAFIFPNESSVDTKIAQFLVSVADIESATGLTFNTPGDKSSVAQVWRADIKALTEDKRNVCNSN